MIEVTTPLPRLLLGRFAWPDTPENLQRVVGRVREIVAGAPGTVVSCIDLREGDVFPKAVAEGLVPMLTANTPKIQRSAFLLGDRAVLGQQTERILRESGHENRRSFKDAAGLVLWLSEVLSPEETEAVRRYLAR